MKTKTMLQIELEDAADRCAAPRDIREIIAERVDELGTLDQVSRELLISAPVLSQWVAALGGGTAPTRTRVLWYCPNCSRELPPAEAALAAEAGNCSACGPGPDDL